MGRGKLARWVGWGGGFQSWQLPLSSGMPGHGSNLCSEKFLFSWSSGELIGLLSDCKVGPGGVVETHKGINAERTG